MSGRRKSQKVRGPRDPETERAEALATIVAFTLRARRVAEHSLAQNREKLMWHARSTWKLETHESGEQYLVIESPPEEQLESAAARVRPIILEGDPAHHGKVTRAIGLLLKDVEDENVHRGLKSITDGWKSLDPDGTDIRGYSLQIANRKTGEKTDALADNVLAFAWIYGDVVHADSERRAKGEPFGVAERYRAAAPLVCQIMVKTINTLTLIQGLSERGLIDLPPDTWTTAVTTPNPIHRERATVHLSEVDSAAMTTLDIDDELGPEWVRQ